MSSPPRPTPKRRRQGNILLASDGKDPRSSGEPSPGESAHHEKVQDDPDTVPKEEIDKVWAIIHKLAHKHKKQLRLEDASTEEADMERALPDEFVPEEPETLRAILDAEHQSHYSKISALRGQRKPIFAQLDTELKNAGISNPVTNFRNGCHRRFYREWIELLRLINPDQHLPWTKEEFLAEFSTTAESNPLVPKGPTVVGGFNIYWKGGKLSFSWLVDGLEESNRGVDGLEPLEPHIIESLRNLEKVFKAHPSRSRTNSREATNYHDTQRAYYMKLLKAWGGYHDGIWSGQNGPANDISMVNPGPWCVIVSEDRNGGHFSEKTKAKNAAALMKFGHEILGVIDGLAAFYRGGALEFYEAAKKYRKFLIEAGFYPDGKPIPNWIEDYADNIWFLIMALVRNHSVTGHKDPGDIGMSVEAVVGDFAGADLCLPELKHRFPVRRGDFVQVAAGVLAHCVMHLYGDRDVLLFLSKNGPENQHQHILWMAPGSEQRREAQGRLDEKLALAEENLIKNHLGTKGSVVSGHVVISDSEFGKSLEGYKLVHVHLHPRKLEKASNAKAAVLKAEKKAKAEQKKLTRRSKIGAPSGAAASTKTEKLPATL